MVVVSCLAAVPPYQAHTNERNHTTPTQTSKYESQVGQASWKRYNSVQKVWVCSFFHTQTLNNSHVWVILRLSLFAHAANIERRPCAAYLHVGNRPGESRRGGSSSTIGLDDCFCILCCQTNYLHLWKFSVIITEMQMSHLYYLCYVYFNPTCYSEAASGGRHCILESLFVRLNQMCY